MDVLTVRTRVTLFMVNFNFTNHHILSVPALVTCLQSFWWPNGQPQHCEGAGQSNMPLMCTYCHKRGGPSHKLQLCSACRNVQYCDAVCQRADYKNHKAPCKHGMKIRQELKEHGFKSDKQKAIREWYEGMPDIVRLQIVSLAWKHRALSPYFTLRGGIDGKPCEIMIITKKMWALFDGGGETSFSWASNFDDPSFDMNKHFFIDFDANHPGSEQWPSMNSRYVFPQRPEMMDQMVAAFFAAERANEARGCVPVRDRPQTRVALKNMKERALNGKTGRLLAADQAAMRYHVILDGGEGRTISVKQSSVEYVETVGVAP